MSQAVCRRGPPDMAPSERAAIRAARVPTPSRNPIPRRVSQLLSGLLAMLADLIAVARYQVSSYVASPALKLAMSSRYKDSVGKSTDWGLGVGDWGLGLGWGLEIRLGVSVGDSVIGITTRLATCLTTKLILSANPNPEPQPLLPTPNS